MSEPEVQKADGCSAFFSIVTVALVAFSPDALVDRVEALVLRNLRLSIGGLL